VITVAGRYTATHTAALKNILCWSTGKKQSLSSGKAN